MALAMSYLVMLTPWSRAFGSFTHWPLTISSANILSRNFMVQNAITPQQGPGSQVALTLCIMLVRPLSCSSGGSSSRTMDLTTGLKGLAPCRML